MPGHTFKARLKQLDNKKKLVLFGSLIAVVGVFLPWYSDVDRFNTGDTYLGITGPLYLAGLIVLLAGIGNGTLMVMELLEKPKPKLPMRESHFHMTTAVISLLMLVIASSVYFHSKFGLNIVDKSAGAGLIMGFIGAALYGLGGFLLDKKSTVKFDQEGEIKPLIDLNVEDRVQSRLEKVEETGREQKSDQAVPVQESMGGLAEDKENTTDLRF